MTKHTDALRYHAERTPREDRGRPHQALPHAARPLARLHAGRRRALPRDRRRPDAAYRVHGEGQPGRRRVQRHGGVRARRHRAARRQAGHGGQGGALQAVRRHRRLRHRDQREDPRSSSTSSRPRADVRRHQPRGHQGPRVLRHRGGAPEKMQIPVFHDDQHGTAIISAAAMLNAAEVKGKPSRREGRGLGGGGERNRVHEPVRCSA